MKTKSALVFVDNNTPLTTSRIIAEKFGKQHAHVVRDIRELIEQIASERDESKIGRVEMFTKSNYTDKKGETRPMYLMTRDGFTLLAMGFTGKKALNFKLQFIDAFNRMEETLRELAANPELVRDQRWLETRLGTKKSHHPFTEAIKMLIEYLESRGQKFHDASFVYGNFTNIIQSRCGVKRGQRDNAPVANLNKLDQVQSMVANIIVKLIAGGKVRTLAEVKAHVILQLDTLDRLLGGEMPLLTDR